MSAQLSYGETAQAATPPTDEQAVRCQDVSGFSLFSTGADGSAQDRCELGHQLLGAWLEGCAGMGSDWVHLQWHMAVFELELGHWEAAFARFERQILPAATTTEDALTDAPALLWRLSLAARRPIELPWQPVRATALARMRRPSSPYVELHNLLALAGAGDLTSLDQWLQKQTPLARSRSEALVARMAAALRAYAGGNFELAATVLANVVLDIAVVGGSRAQNRLFTQLAQAAQRQARRQVAVALLKVA